MPILNWIGKDKVVNHHNQVPYRVLDPQYNYGKNDNGNMIIHGDNLDALKALLPRFEGKVNLVYIDPPYNTGNEKWVYNDNVNDSKIKKWLGEVVGKEGEDLSRHDKWLCMMYPRLKLLQRLLSDDGAIFISIDNNEVFGLKFLCDEIFGSSNFIDCIAVINNLKGRSDNKYVATAHESLLIYHKGTFVTKGVAVPDEYDSEYNLGDERGRYRLQGLRKRGSEARRQDRPNMYYPFYFCPSAQVLSLDKYNENVVEILPYLSDGSEGRWRWSRETAINRLDELTTHIVRGRNEYDVFQKDYITDEKRIKPKSFWSGSEFSAEAGTLEVKQILGKDSFSTPKPTGLLDYILEQATNPDSIVLDSFAGSGTTAHAVLNMNKRYGGNRKFILIEMEDYAENITAERVRRVIDGYGDGKSTTEGTGGGFTYYELGQQLLMDDGNLNENVDIEKIYEYIWYTETRSDYMPQDEDYLLGILFNTAYYFYYDKDNATVLDRDFLRTIKTKTDGYLIYADINNLSADEMESANIRFKKIPRDITRL